MVGPVSILCINLCLLSEPTSQRSVSVPVLTDSSLARLLQQESRPYFAVAARAAASSQPNSMLPRRRRLSRPGFSALRSAKRASTAHFLVLLAKVPGKGGVAVVVPKKVASRAVDRHLLKRRIMATLHSFETPGIALVVHAKSGALTLPYQTLRTEVLELVHSVSALSTHHS